MGSKFLLLLNLHHNLNPFFQDHLIKIQSKITIKNEQERK